MLADKSLFYYGSIYNKLFDPPLAEARQVVIDLIDKGSSVLDIACGTGLLSFALAANKHCRVVGIDLSLRMLEFAKKANRSPEVTFMHLDATELAVFADGSFDCATLLFLMHELPREKQLRVLVEGLRVAKRLIIVDSAVPLPTNLSAFGIRFVEATFGREHHRNFGDFLAGGGIAGILEDSRLPLTVAHRSVFWRSCREVVMISKRE